MARYVPIYKDLDKVKPKVLFGLTKRQLVCLGIAGGVGLPLFWNTYKTLGTDAALWVMMLVCLPILSFAAYKDKQGRPLEKVLFLRLRNKVFPSQLVYRTHNFFATLQRKISIEQEAKRLEHEKNKKAKGIAAHTAGAVHRERKGAHKTAGAGHAGRRSRKNPAIHPGRNSL